MSKWYEQFDKLSSSLFTWENSGRGRGGSPPKCIGGLHGKDKTSRVLGYGANPPFPSMGSRSCVAVMFENTETFEKTWWHYLKE